MCLPIAQLLGDVDVKPRLVPLCSTRPEEEGWGHLTRLNRRCAALYVRTS